MRLTARGRCRRGAEGPQQQEDGVGGRGQRGQETPTLRGTNTSPCRTLQELVLRNPAVRPPPPGRGGGAALTARPVGPGALASPFIGKLPRVFQEAAAVRL